MISETELEARLEHARQNPEEEPEFFRCLLDATVYAHAPISDDRPGLRLIQFKHPDGFDALPFFTSEAKAAVAAGRTARIVTSTGRELFEMTRGAILMLNPNDGGSLLYPEEIWALLATGTMAPVRKETSDGSHVGVGVPDREPRWLVPVLTRTLTLLPPVQAAYLIQTSASNSESISLLIVLAVAKKDSERAARACLTAMQPSLLKSPPDYAIDLTVFDPAQGVPNYVADSGVEPFYSRVMKDEREKPGSPPTALE